MSTKLDKLFELEEQHADLYKSDYLWQSSNARGTYGGHLVSIALKACSKTIPQTGLNIHSIHSCFLRGGGREVPAFISIDRTRDGKSFASRSVTITQKGKHIFNLFASYHNESRDSACNLSIKHPMPEVLHHSKIDQLTTAAIERPYTVAVHHDGPVSFDRPLYIKSFLTDFPVELKPIDPVKFFSRAHRPTTDLQCWFRLNADFGEGLKLVTSPIISSLHICFWLLGF